jgi:hypothetical protein
MGLNRRTFLKGLVATTAGVIVPQQVMAEPERRIWALDSTMVKPAISPDYQAYLDYMADPERFTYNFGGSLHSNKITVGDYQADYVIGDDQLYNPVFQTTVDTNGGVWKMIPNPTPWAHTVIYDDGQ